MTDTAIFAGKLIVGPAHQVIDNGAVLVSGSTIRAVGPAGRIEQLLVAGTARLDYPGATLLPGLIDSHVHLCFDSSATPFALLEEAPQGELMRTMADHARQLLHSGVTTARDLGDRDGLAALLRDDITRGAAHGPSLITAGTPLTCPGGHCAFLGGEVSTDAEISDRIRRNKAAGADLIKVMASGGALSPGGPPMWAAQFSAAQLEHVVATAQGHQLRVAAHAHGTTTIADCVAAGVSTIEHCSWRTKERLVYDPHVARLMAERDISVCRCVSGDWRLFLDQLGANAEPLIESILEPPWDGHGPAEGTLDAGDTATLVEVLAAHTATVGGTRRCWFCLWDGYGWDAGSYFVAVDAPPDVRANPPRLPDPVPARVRSGARVRLPWRDYFLYSGDLTAAGAFLPEKGQSANLWWPEDRSWCVASEIDLPWTYLAGPVELIDAVLRDPRLEALPAHPDDPCTLQVPDWLDARLAAAVDELIATHTTAVTTSRGIARASLRSPTRLHDGQVRIELHRAGTSLAGAGSSEARLAAGPPDPDQLRETVSFYLLHAILGLARN